MNKVTVEELIEELYEMIDRASRVPLSSKCMLDPDEIRDVLRDIEENLPQESRQARAIVADRNQIIGDARREAETIIRVAEERVRVMVNQDMIVRQAEEKARDLMAQTELKIKEMRRASNEYIEDLMRRTDEAIAGSLSELRKTRQEIKASQRSGLN